MPNTVTTTCPWCGSRDQTADVLGSQKASNAPKFLNSMALNAYCLSLQCRGCRAFFVSTIVFQPNINIAHTLNNSATSDLSSAIVQTAASSPSLDIEVSSAIPETVREALIDAYEARRPRAKCTHFRSSIEFALREAGLSAAPGDTLGAILTKAKKNFAMPDALITLCDQVKAFGNWGLHWAEMKIEEEDAVAA